MALSVSSVPAVSGKQVVISSSRLSTRASAVIASVPSPDAIDALNSRGPRGLPLASASNTASGRESVSSTLLSRSIASNGGLSRLLFFNIGLKVPFFGYQASRPHFASVYQQLPVWLRTHRSSTDLTSSFNGCRRYRKPFNQQLDTGTG